MDLQEGGFRTLLRSGLRKPSHAVLSQIPGKIFHGYRTQGLAIDVAQFDTRIRVVQQVLSQPRTAGCRADSIRQVRNSGRDSFAGAFTRSVGLENQFSFGIESRRSTTNRAIGALRRSSLRPSRCTAENTEGPVGSVATADGSLPGVLPAALSM